MTDFSSYFLPALADDFDLGAWSDLLPAGSRVLRTNLFGDSMLVDSDGAIHILERAAASVSKIAANEEEFWLKIVDDDEGWQLRRLTDDCRAAGKTLAPHQCYAFTTLPYLGGDYTVENVWVCSWEEWFSFTADIYTQTKNLPDGTPIELRISSKRAEN
jgi:hypothetical protein